METLINYMYSCLLFAVFAVSGSAIKQPALVSYDTWSKPYIVVDIVPTHKGFKFWWRKGKMKIKFYK